jgi:hypothetical protein
VGGSARVFAKLEAERPIGMGVELENDFPVQMIRRRPEPTRVMDPQKRDATRRSVDARRRKTTLAILERRSRARELSCYGSPELQAEAALEWIGDLLAFSCLFVEELLEPLDLLPLGLAIRHDDLLNSLDATDLRPRKPPIGVDWSARSYQVSVVCARRYSHESRRLIG